MPSITRIFARLTSRSIAAKVNLNHSKKLFELAGQLLSPDATDQAGLFQTLLIQREKIGSTGIGSGVAIPHAMTKKVDYPHLAVISLAQGIPFDAPDQHSVDLFFFLILPDQAPSENEAILKKMATLGNNPTIQQALRKSADTSQLYQALLIATVLDDE